MRRQTDKSSPEKSGFDFLGEFVLAEDLAVELDSTKSGTAPSAGDLNQLKVVN
ncbi:hypothetical protein LIT25_20290 [Bacillus sp. F19]|nr:hypothetical protein LIT25_20290 [Bacillus sp. F19]